MTHCCRFPILVLVASAFAGSLIMSGGCNPDAGAGGSSGSDSRSYIDMGTAPPGGAFSAVGDAIVATLNKHAADYGWELKKNGTKGTQQNIRMLEKGELQLGMSNAAIAWHATRGEGMWDKQYRLRTVATLAPNIGLFIARKGSGIRTIADLKGKRVATGPAGAGVETFLGPILTRHGVQYTAEEQDFTPVPATYTAAAQMLGDGDIDAAFMGGAIPIAAVVQATSTIDLEYLQFDNEILDQLIQEYPFFQSATIPAKNKQGKPTYKGLTEDLPTLNVGSMHLITHADVDEETVYQLTKTLWENRSEVASQHPAGNAINEQNVVRFTGVDFHPGAIRFYKEIGIWPEAN